MRSQPSAGVSSLLRWLILGASTASSPHSFGRFQRDSARGEQSLGKRVPIPPTKKWNGHCSAGRCAAGPLPDSFFFFFSFSDFSCSPDLHRSSEHLATCGENLRPSRSILLVLRPLSNSTILFEEKFFVLRLLSPSPVFLRLCFPEPAEKPNRHYIGGRLRQQVSQPWRVPRPRLGRPKVWHSWPSSN